MCQNSFEAIIRKISACWPKSVLFKQYAGKWLALPLPCAGNIRVNCFSSHHGCVGRAQPRPGLSSSTAPPIISIKTIVTTTTTIIIATAAASVGCLRLGRFHRKHVSWKYFHPAMQGKKVRPGYPLGSKYLESGPASEYFIQKMRHFFFTGS